MGMLFFFLVILTVGHSQAQSEVQEWANTVNSGTDKMTSLEFYVHDILSGESPLAVPVAKVLNTSDPEYLTRFGNVFMADDMLTTSPDPNSKLVGRVQGLYGSASMEEFSLIMAMSYNFIDGAYNGSSISIVGRNWASHPVRELPVVGGTGVFRMARGYAITQTHWMDLDSGDAIVGYNVTVLH